MTVSIGLLLSLSTPGPPDSTVVVETRAPNGGVQLPRLGEGNTNGGRSPTGEWDNAANSSNSTLPVKHSRTLSETVVSNGDNPRSAVMVPTPPNSLSPLRWETTGPKMSWSPSICEDFVGNPYTLHTTVCPRITCHGSGYSKSTGTCSMKGVAVQPSHLYNALKNISIKKMKTSNDIIMQSKCAWLVQNEGYQACSDPVFKQVESYLEPLDYAKPFVKMASFLKPQSSGCNRWIKGTTFFYIGMENHIYFKFLGWYNLHKSLLAHYQLTNYTIIRLPEGNNDFLFPEFEHALFPNVLRLQDLKEDTVCFEDLVLVPWAYGAPPFRCRIENALKRKCTQCNGKGIESDYKSFRRRVLSACGLTESSRDNTKNILVIERKQYNRRLDDKPKSFTRVWVNSEDLILDLKREFPQYNVTGIYAETLTVCEQIQYALDANIMIGMHGAGMVHLWWTRDDAKIIELVPKSHKGNFAFKNLATFLGRTYKDYTKVVGKKDNTVTVNTQDIINLIKPLI